MVRWISLTSAWLGAAKAKVPRRFSRSAFWVRRGPICCRGVRRRVATEACEKGRRRLRLCHRWGRARIRQASCPYQRVNSWAPRPHAAVWLPSLGCPLGRSLPRLPMGWRGLARRLCTSPPMVVRPGSTLLSGSGVRFLASGPVARRCHGVSAWHAEDPRRQPVDSSADADAAAADAPAGDAAAAAVRTAVAAAERPPWPPSTPPPPCHRRLRRRRDDGADADADRRRR